jgi:ATP synthase protein I
MKATLRRRRFRAPFDLPERSHDMVQNNNKDAGIPDPKLNDLTDRLKDLGGRIAAEKSEQSAAAATPASYQAAQGYSKGYRIMSEFVAGVIVGGLIGYGIDYVAGTLPLFLIIFLLLGFGAGLMSMSRAANRAQPTPEELAKMKPVGADDDEEED